MSHPRQDSDHRLGENAEADVAKTPGAPESISPGANSSQDSDTQPGLKESSSQQKAEKENAR
jgi:hypothetical protein